MANREEQRQAFPLNRINYILLAVAAGIILIGFLLMVGGGTGNPNKFDYDEIFSFRRITLAPLTVLLGYALVMVAILYRPKKEKEEAKAAEDEQEEG